MTRSQRRLVGLGVAIPIAVLASALLYMLGMSWLEHSPRSYWRSLEWAIETITTTGYGGDAHWNRPAMVVYVGLVQFVGVFLVFLVFPIYLIPFLEERFEVRLPREATSLSGHVLIYRYGPAVESLIEQLEQVRSPYVVVEQDEERVRNLLAKGRRVIYGPEDGDALAAGGLDQAGLLEARAFILALDSDDATLFSTVIAKNRAPDVPVIARINHSKNVQRVYQAGADFALSLSHVSGQMLARRLLGEEAFTIDTQLKVVRVPVGALEGRSAGDLSIREGTGCSIVAVERGDEVVVELDGDFRFLPDDTLFVCGSNEAVRSFQQEFPV